MPYYSACHHLHCCCSGASGGCHHVGGGGSSNPGQHPTPGSVEVTHWGGSHCGHFLQYHLAMAVAAVCMLSLSSSAE